jgi:hypothetical protein
MDKVQEPRDPECLLQIYNLCFTSAGNSFYRSDHYLVHHKTTHVYSF